MSIFSRGLFAVVSAFLITWSAYSQEPKEVFRRHQQEELLSAIRKHEAVGIVVVYLRGSEFSTYLKASAKSAMRGDVRLCDAVSMSVQEPYLARRDISKEEWTRTFHQSVARFFKVPTHFVEAKSCDASSFPDVDGVVLSGRDAKQLLTDLARKNTLFSPGSDHPRFDVYALDVAVPSVARQILEARQDFTKKPSGELTAQQPRRPAEQALLALQNMKELEHQAQRGDYKAALEGEFIARLANDRLKQIQFRIWGAHSGPLNLKVDIARDLFTGANGLPKDPVEARALLEEALKADYVPAMLLLADHLARPNAYSDENRRSLELLGRAAALGSASANKELDKLRNIVAANEERRTQELAKRERQRADDVLLANRIRNLGWFGRIEVHPVKWNPQFEGFLPFKFEFTSKGLTKELRRDLEKKERIRLEAAGMGGSTTVPLVWKDDLCWEAKELLLGRIKVAYRPFWQFQPDSREAGYFAAGAPITEIVHRSCIANGQIELEIEVLIEFPKVKGYGCLGRDRAGPRGGCLKDSEGPGRATLAVGPRPTASRSAAPPSLPGAKQSPVSNDTRWSQFSVIDCTDQCVTTVQRCFERAPSPNCDDGYKGCVEACRAKQVCVDNWHRNPDMRANCR